MAYWSHESRNPSREEGALLLPIDRPGSCHAHLCTPPPVHTPPVSGRDHQPRRLAVLSRLPQRPRCRRAAVHPWSHRHRRGDPEVVPEIRPSVCPSAPTPPAQAGRQGAPGRGVFDQHRRTALPVACGRSGWPHPGYARPKPSKHAGGEEVVPPVDNAFRRNP